MTEEQKEKRREYMKLYWAKNKERAKENRKRWYENNKEKQYAFNRAVYQRQKENNNTWFQRNKDKVNEYNRQYRNKKIEELKANGVINPWSVYFKKSEPKYESK